MLVRFAILLISIFVCSIKAYADVEFHCHARINVLQRGLAAYLQVLKIPVTQVAQTVDPHSGSLKLALKTSPADTRTLDFYMRPEFALSTEKVRLPTSIKGKMRVLNTVSRKEIMLALMQHGRVTIFQDEACSVEALSDRVGVRQNIVAWSEHLNWDWPDGGPAKWNPKYWTRGTPNPGVSLHDAVMDAFIHQEKYAMGCYTATKLVIVQGTLDYYSRVKRDPLRTSKVEKELLSDGDPLVGIEPGRMWNFESDFDPRQMGKKRRPKRRAGGRRRRAPLSPGSTTQTGGDADLGEIDLGERAAQNRSST